MNLVKTWLTAAQRGGEPLSVVVAELNAALGTDYRPSRVGEWRDGRRAIPEPVQRHMLQLALYDALRRRGIEPDDGEDPDGWWNDLIAEITPPDRQPPGAPERSPLLPMPTDGGPAAP